MTQTRRTAAFGCARSHRPARIYNRSPYEGSEYGEHDTVDPDQFDESDAVPVEVKAGSVVFLMLSVAFISKKSKH